jgi:hypothetical protein
VTRIFFSLAIFSLLCVAAALLLGLYVGDLHSVIDASLSDSERQTIIDRAVAHRLAGLAAALVVVLVNSIAVTYFIGTGRWCKEVVERYALDPALITRSKAIKRRAFPWAVSSMLLMVGVVAMGAAADPGTGLPNTAEWVLPHFLASLAIVGLLGVAYFVLASNIRAHYGVINEIVAEVRRIRQERGLDV